MFESAFRAILEEALAPVLAKLEALGAAAPVAPWMTIPKAARACGVSTKRARLVVKGGAVQTRSRSLQANPRRLQLEVNIESLRAALSAVPQPSNVTDASTWAAARASRGSR